MADLLVVRTGDRRMPERRTSNLVVLVAVAAGLLFGALACAAGPLLARAHAHPSAFDVDVASWSAGDHPSHADRAAHTGSGSTSAAQPTSAGDHGPGRGDAAPTVESHPGMACVVSVDLRFPHPAVAPVSESCGTVAAAVTSEWSADVDPPVPRSS